MLIGEQLLVVGDLLLQVGQLLEDLEALEVRETAEAHIDDRLRLDLCQGEGLHELFHSHCVVSGLLDDPDDLIDVLKPDLQSKEDVGALLGLPEVEAGAPGHHLLAVVDVVGEHVLEGEQHRPPIDEGKVVDVEVRLQGGTGKELVEHDHDLGADLQLDDEANAVAVTLITHRCDHRDGPILAQVVDLLGQVGLVDLVGQLGEDDHVMVTLVGLDLVAAAYHDPAPAGGERVSGALHAADDRTTGEVRPLDMLLYQLIDGDVGVVDHRNDRRADLTEVVRGHVGGHADGDSTRSIGQEEGEGCRQYGGLAERVVVVGAEVNGLLLDIGEHLIPDPAHLRLGVPHRRSRVAVNGTEVPLWRDHRVAEAEVLGEAHQRIVDRRIPVGVVLAQYVSDDTGTLLIG